MNRYKVIIVGGGPAGAMTALSLARMRPDLAGDILLLETKPFPRRKICGGGVSGRVVTFLESLDVSLDAIPHVPVERITVCFGPDRSSAPFGNERCCVVRRSAFDQLLLGVARERGIEVRTSTPAIGAYRERKGIAVVDRDGNVYHAGILVGADGVNGRSRTWFGAPHRSRKSLLLQTDFPRDMDVQPFRDGLVMDFSPGKSGIPGYVWFFPSVGEEGEPVVNAGITGGRFVRGSYGKLRAAFLAILDHHPEIGAPAPEDIRFRAYPERNYAIFQPKARERVLFVGEQLGVDGFVGEGLSICAESASAAALEIVNALDGGDFTFRGYSRRLARSDFFPLLLAGKPFWIRGAGQKPSPVLAMATRKPPPGKENSLEIYATIFSGSRPGKFAFSPYAGATALRAITGMLVDRLRT